jgi:hypothetical protein
MAISLVAIGDKIRASLINQLIGQVNAIALVGQIPTVSGSGVTVSPGGAVVFTNASAVTVTGAFNSTYDNYRIVWDIPSQTAGADLQMHLSNTGTDDVSGNYSYTRGYDNGSAGSRTVNMVTAASVWYLTAGASSTQTNFGYMDLSGPALARYTSGLAQAVVRNTTPQMYTTSTNLHMNTSTAYDGFSIFPASGTMSGTLRVYGYNNLA